jgi:hypothetical protein
MQAMTVPSRDSPASIPEKSIPIHIIGVAQSACPAYFPACFPSGAHQIHIIHAICTISPKSILHFATYPFKVPARVHDTTEDLRVFL